MEILRPMFQNSTLLNARDPYQAFFRTTKVIDQDSTLRVSLNPSEFHFNAINCTDPTSITEQQRHGEWSCQEPISFQKWAFLNLLWNSASVNVDMCVLTQQLLGASLKTYVIGDKTGWDCIRTQALWHAIINIWWDYGAIVWASIVIIATLDTDLATMSHLTPRILKVCHLLINAWV